MGKNDIIPDADIEPVLGSYMNRGVLMVKEEWIPVLDEKVLDENGAACVNPKGMPVLLMKRQGQIFALSNRCPHMGCALAGGSVDGFTLTCPCHDWRFDIRTGKMSPETGIILGSYEWKTDQGKISIKIRSD
jgi:3-phenylpropionate/trans-cinnamate dioxygenase ferredoxin subunit